MDFKLSFDQWVSVTSALGQVGAFGGLAVVMYHGSKVALRAERVDNFNLYTKEYREARGKLPRDFFTSKEFNLNDQQLTDAEELVNVFAREYSVWRNGGVAKHDWKWWKRGMTKFLDCPNGRHVWDKLMDHERQGGNPEFTDPFMDHMEEQVRQIDADHEKALYLVPHHNVLVPFCSAAEIHLCGGTIQEAEEELWSLNYTETNPTREAA